jgi:microcin C transport system substrate-binding protein
LVRQRRLVVRRRQFLAAGAAALAVPLRARAQAPAEDAPTPAPAAPRRTYGLALVGEPKLPEGFPYFPYVNPNAPKGGEVALANVGSFDSLNPFILRGTAPAGLGRLWDSLLRNTADEPETGYGHLAETIEVGADRSYVAFELRPEAHFHDGSPITAEDVVWTFTTLREKGRPQYRQYYSGVDRVQAEGPHRVVFHFKSGGNRELPMILGELQVLPRKFWEGRDFAAPLNDVPLGSGAYRVGHFELGRTLVMERVPDYWARDLPTGRGLDNFDRIREEYFRDSSVALQAFKAGQIDWRRENISKVWSSEYDFPAVQKGLVRKQAFPSDLPTGMQCFVMNTRRPVFANRDVRHAMTELFDFEWENKNLFYGLYTRTSSFFSNSDCASSGLPDAAELALLEPFRDKLPPELFTAPFTLPVTDGSGNNRDGLKRALALLERGGMHMHERKLVDPAGQQISFEILLEEPSFERVALPYVQSLQRVGIDARVRTVDPSQYQHLTDAFDFDMTMNVFGESDSPGNELTGFWSSAAAKEPGSDNLAGVADPVVDALIAKVVAADSRAALVTAARALDRVLLWGWYVMPQWHIQSAWVAWWDRLGHPDAKVRSGVVFDAWWVDPDHAAKLEAAKHAEP